MEDFFENLLIQNGCYLEEARLFQSEESPFWHSTVIGPDKHPISAGFSGDRSRARKIALAEFLERREYRNIANSSAKIRNQWGLNLIPTACGFAAGFDRNNTVLRSIKEAAERWVMSQWIDGGFEIHELPAVEIAKTLDPASSFFASHFCEVRFFRKSILLNLNGTPLEVMVAQTMGLTEKGIFPGSSSQISSGNIWQHALLESFRHLLVIRNNEKRTGRFPDEKVHYFSTHREVALEQISRAKKQRWPSPDIALHREAAYMTGKYYLARTILKGWASWDSGPLERFLF